jgi:hypothetical protein
MGLAASRPAGLRAVSWSGSDWRRGAAVPTPEVLVCIVRDSWSLVAFECVRVSSPMCTEWSSLCAGVAFAHTRGADAAVRLPIQLQPSFGRAAQTNIVGLLWLPGITGFPMRHQGNWLAATGL